MNIIKNFIFRGKNKEIELLSKKIEEKNIEIINITSESDKKGIQINKLKLELDDLNKISAESISKALADNNNLKDKIYQLEKGKRKLVGAIGGLTKRNNELVAENTELAFKLTELKNEFEEFKKNRFVVKKVKAQKVPKGQIMGLKSGTKTSKIISKVKPNEKEVEV